MRSLSLLALAALPASTPACPFCDSAPAARVRTKLRSQNWGTPLAAVVTPFALAGAAVAWLLRDSPRPTRPDA